MKEVNSNAETLKKNSLELMELKHVLLTTQLFFDEVGAANPNARFTAYWHAYLSWQSLKSLLADWLIIKKRLHERFKTEVPVLE